MHANSNAYGTVTAAADGTYTVAFERELVDAPERVWKALTDPAEVRQWFTEMTLEPRPGGRVFLDFGEEGSAEGEILRWEPPHVLEHSWSTGETTSRVRWELEAAERGTRLTLRHTGLVAEERHEYGAGWHGFLDRMRVYLAGETVWSTWDGFRDRVEEYRQRAGVSGA